MRLIGLAFLFTLSSEAFSQVLINNVTVVDVEKQKLLPGYTVLLINGKIETVSNKLDYKLSESTTIIDGSGKYLVPGFADGHIHFFQDGGIHARPDVIDLRKSRPYSEEIRWTHQHMEDQLRRYLAAGITSVIDVGSNYSFLQQRDSLQSKKNLPLIRITGPLLTTYIPPPFRELNEADIPFVLMTAEEKVRQAVREQVQRKADFIKIWYIVMGKDAEADARKSLPLVKAAIDEAHKQKLKVAVHATERIAAQLSVEAGADFLVHSVEDEIVTDDFVKLLKKNKTALCPTLVVMANYFSVLGDNYRFNTAELNLANPATVGSIIDFPLPDTAIGNSYIKNIQTGISLKEEAKTDSIRIRNLKKLADGGVTIVTGTDAGNIGTQHAGSYFAELQAMQRAGLSLWQLLQASTINAAICMGQEKDWGSIASGKQANLVLLNKNPLESLSNWQSIDLVINKGVTLKPDSIIQSTPEQLVQMQLNAYNAHDLDAFLAPYADDVEIYDFPGKLLSKGKEQMRKDYIFITQTPKLYCHLQNRIVQGNMVIDHEEVWFGQPKPVYALAIYIIEKGKISKVYFKQ
jgi:imidazolonepropionase-like amidohydrolase